MQNLGVPLDVDLFIRKFVVLPDISHEIKEISNQLFPSNSPNSDAIRSSEIERQTLLLEEIPEGGLLSREQLTNPEYELTTLLLPIKQALGDCTTFLTENPHEFELGLRCFENIIRVQRLLANTPVAVSPILEKLTIMYGMNVFNMLISRTDLTHDQAKRVQAATQRIITEDTFEAILRSEGFISWICINTPIKEATLKRYNEMPKTASMTKFRLAAKISFRIPAVRKILYSGLMWRLTRALEKKHVLGEEFTLRDYMIALEPTENPVSLLKPLVDNRTLYGLLYASLEVVENRQKVHKWMTLVLDSLLNRKSVQVRERTNSYNLELDIQGKVLTSKLELYSHTHKTLGFELVRPSMLH